MKSWSTTIATAILLGFSSLSAQEAPRLSGLEDLFTAGPVFQDRNGDGVVDFVDTRLILGESATASDIAAAADVSARLGFETMAINLPLPLELSSSSPGILIGSGAVERVGLSSAEVLAGLEAGEGMVKLLSSGERTFVVVAGVDESGTRAAAAALAGYIPHVGDPNGKQFADVLAELEEVLSEQEVALSTVHVSEVLVAAEGGAFTRMTLEAELDSAAAVRKARSILRQIARRNAPADEGEPPLSYPGTKVLRVLLTPSDARSVLVDVPRIEPEDQGGPVAARPGAGAKKKLDLSNIYTNDGLLGDSDKNVISDRIDGMLSPHGVGTDKTVDLAARLGLESTGVTIPIARLPESIADPKKEPTLVLIGISHPLVMKLVEEGKLERPDLGPGEGLVEVVPNAFGEKTAMVVAGGDARGLARALEQVSERFPNVWERGKDRTTVDDIEMDLWRFFSGRSPAGQAATALYKLDRLAAKLSHKDLSSAQVLVSVEKPADGLDEVIEKQAAALGADTLEVTIDNRDVENAKIIHEEDFVLDSEVDELWQVFQSRVLPKFKKKRPFVLEARLSEPLEVRKQVEERIRAALANKGARESDLDIRVLSAFKQGYSWLYDAVRPKLAGKEIKQIVIRFAENGPPPEWKQQAIYTPVRWLKEIFPIDEVLAKELGIDLKAIRFEKMPVGSPTYEVIATDPAGNTIHQETFEPKFVLRPYMDRFRDYEMVRVTTGWIRAQLGDKTLADQRILTETERFWDHYQEETLPAVYDYVMKLHQGNPRGNGQDAPYFGKLTVELELSEPDTLIGVDKEVLSSMDAMHEEIYFGTLWFFRLLGRNARGQELTYVGRVIPIMRPKKDGSAGRAKITLTGFATSRPAVVVDYEERDGSKGSARLDLPKITMDRPSALAAWVRDGVEGLERIHVRVKVDTEEDQRDELILRARKEQVDEQMISGEQVKAVLSNLESLRSAGLYRESLAYHDLGDLRVAAGWTHDVDRHSEMVSLLDPNGRPKPFPDIRDLIPEGYRHQGEEFVQWDEPIPPREANEIMARMSTLPEVTTYKAGESYLGRDIWAMDLMPPLEASHWSQAKATTFKPTALYSAREHANEVSSTSHVLKLAERLLTDPESRKKLDKVNVVIQPVLNADGAQLAYDLYKITPEFILHAGYLGPLGVNADADSRRDMPIYPEAKVRPRLWNMWLPDLFLNPHGYPSHQVVQLFSEFDGLVRRGRITERNWSMNKGWFIPGFRYLDDPELPRHRDAAFKIRDYITDAINAAPDVYAMNQRNYDRYRRYGVQFDDEAYKMDMTDDVLIYMPLKGAKIQPAGGQSRGFNPRVTIWSGGTEAPDETAHGDWMKLVATAGLQWDEAVLQYLVDGDHKVERKGSTFWGGIRLHVNRPRPPKVHEEDDKAEKKTNEN